MENNGRGIAGRLAGLSGRFIVCLAILPALAFAVPVQADPKIWRAGNYSFSDELGGFTIRAVSGLGSRDSPVVIEQELNSASPVTMIVRAAAAASGDSRPEGNLATGSLYLRIVTINGSGQSWLEFEFELQEVLHQSSVFGDGLSFDQRKTTTDAITSDRFSRYSRDFEPYDRLRFWQGKVDPADTASFDFQITDFTPRWQFYIVMDPRIPYS